MTSKLQKIKKSLILKFSILGVLILKIINKCENMDFYLKILT